MIKRRVKADLSSFLDRGRSVLLLGPRQTGKTTLLTDVAADREVTLLLPSERQKYEQHPDALAEEVRALHSARGSQVPLVVIDEIQKVPALLDVVQWLIDQKLAQFVVTGSSARKLRRQHANLLAGRINLLRLDPVSQAEFSDASLTDRLIYGSLPRTLTTSSPADREADLSAYVATYLEEEVRSEALVRNLARFGRFLELAASESGLSVNFQRLSQKVGVAHTTIMDYYQILEDCLIVERIEPWTESRTRKRLIRAQKYLFFDLGVRRLAAREGTQPAISTWGHWFEQWVGLEILWSLRHVVPKASLHYWRDPAGPEIDWVIREEGRVIPVEVKWTDNPEVEDVKHLKTFLAEYPEAERGYVLCRINHARKMSDRITALPWQQLESVFTPQVGQGKG